MTPPPPFEKIIEIKSKGWVIMGVIGCVHTYNVNFLLKCFTNHLFYVFYIFFVFQCDMLCLAMSFWHITNLITECMCLDHAEYEEFEQNSKKFPKPCDKNIIIKYLLQQLKPAYFSSAKWTKSIIKQHWNNALYS